MVGALPNQILPLQAEAAGKSDHYATGFTGSKKMFICKVALGQPFVVGSTFAYINKLTLKILISLSQTSIMILFYPLLLQPQMAQY